MLEHIDSWIGKEFIELLSNIYVYIPLIITSLIVIIRNNSIKSSLLLTVFIVGLIVLVAYTLGLGVVGAGAGTGFAFIPNPAKLGVGYAIGIPVGTTVGLITGLITPGLKYHAKQGEEIPIILCEDLCINKQCQ